MEVSGRIIAILPEATGQGKNGTWRSRDAVLETDGQYPKKVVFNLFGDFIDKFPFNMSDLVTVYFDIDSREHNGRWYPSIKAWKVIVGSSAPVAVAQSLPNDSVVTEAVGGVPSAGGDDLPFN
jgi:hypothetical protein